MAADLIIGPLDSEIQEHVLRICKRIGLKDWPASGAHSGWFSRLIAPPAQKPVDESIMISVLNVASLHAFNTYAAGLEGHSGPDAMMKTAFHNLPWWLQSVRLPIEFHPPKDLASDEGDPTFVGSSVRLLDELSKIKEKSSIDIAAMPPSYADMRNDYRNWSWSSHHLSEDDTIRWVWNALCEGAHISIEKRFPMILAS